MRRPFAAPAWRPGARGNLRGPGLGPVLPSRPLISRRRAGRLRLAGAACAHAGWSWRRIGAFRARTRAPGGGIGDVEGGGEGPTRVRGRGGGRGAGGAT